MLRIVAADLAADASMMTNRTAVAKAHELAVRLWKLRDAIAGAKWDEVEVLWQDYQTLEQEYQAELR